MELFLDTNNVLYLSYKFLNKNGINNRSVENWKRRNQSSVLKTNGFAYVDYRYIPSPSKSKLPSESELLAILDTTKRDNCVKICSEKLRYAQRNKFSDYRAYYRDAYGLSNEESMKASMKRAVWERLIQLYNESHSTGFKGGIKKGAVVTLYGAYNLVYPGQYSSKHAFLRVIKCFKDAGIDSIIIDKRKVKDLNSLKFGHLHRTFINGITSIGKAYSAPQIWQKLTGMCLAANIETPSLTWVKTHIKKNTRHSEYGSRYGTDKLEKTMPYASMQPALHADKQWQVDGWNLPFYFKNEKGYLDKLDLIAVRDAYSKKIVGYSISRSENRVSIMEAFEDAIATTGCLPFEIIVDNHSFNRTKEAEHFISEINKLGVTWTVTENPQYKAIAERYFKTIGEQFCKNHYGYIGQGIKTKDKNGRSSDELIQQYIKAGKILTESEIKLIGISVVKQFNETNLKSYKVSPNHLYTNSDKPARFEIDLYERLRILTKKSEYKISRGQINIIISGVKHEYQVNAATYHRYNGKKVSVRYDNTDLIYLFDLKTDAPICSVKQKSRIHGALADQTERDIQLLSRNKGLRKGIIAQSRKETEEMIAEALKINPHALEILHRYTTPKDVLKQAETDYEFRNEAERRGIDLARVTTVPKTTEITNPLYLHKKKTLKELSPFLPDNHIMGLAEDVEE
ncbi:MAG: hypothetical protein WKF68_02495 [Daejeonella sp.]